MNRRTFSKLLTTLMVVGQFAWVVPVAADTSPSPTIAPTPTVSATPTPTATATPAPTANPTVTPTATPVPSATAAPTVAPDPSPKATAIPAAVLSPSPTATPSETAKTRGPEVTPSPAAGAPKVTGHDGCGGEVPDWVFDTASQTWAKADQSSFACDKTSGYYLSPKYYYDTRSGWYEIIPPVQVAAGLPTYMLTAPNVVHTVLGDLVVGSSDYQVAKALGLLDGSGAGGILMPAGASGSTTASGLVPATAPTAQSQSWFDLTNLVNVVNILQSNAISGNVSASNNTSVGNMSSGAANIVANLINLLASAWSWSNGSLSFFMQNIIAPLTGDILLNPTVSTTGGGGGLGSATINNTGAGSTNTVGLNNPSSLSVNTKDSGSITNNVNLNAASGNATATGNTTVGNIASGNATAQVNIINLINSFITSGSSFFGIINIYGNLHGDILFPAGFLNSLIPASVSAPATTTAISGTGPGSTNQLGVNNSGAANINNSISNSVNNNISTTAASGAAGVESTSAVGSVKTGSASTNQNIFNLANSSIFGDNAVLVMVNVLGHWVGKIMNLPGTGNSQSALLTGNATVAPTAPLTNLGITGTGAGSTNQANVDNSKTAKVNQQSVGTITNNVNVNAQSGNANAKSDTSVGNVSTGNAKADASVANIFNSVLNVSHWFGVLIINVFGDWTGDVNHDSAAGGYSTAAGRAEGAAMTSGQVGAVSGVMATPGSGGVAFQLPKVGLLSMITPAAGSGGDNGVGTGAAVNTGTTSGQVLTAAATTTPANNPVAAAQARDMSLVFVISSLIMLVAGALLKIDKQLRR